jgi:hypothetical protein
MDNLILTPAMYQAFARELVKHIGGDVEAMRDAAAQVDAQLPSDYFGKMARFQQGFNRRNPRDAVSGVTFDNAEPKWNFNFPGITNFDGTESIFIARMLEFIRPGVYAKKYPLLLWSRDVPGNSSLNTGTEAYTVLGSDYAGQVKVSKMPATDTNMVNQSVYQATMGFFSMTLGYQYNLQEIRNALYANQPLQTTLAMNCRNLMERKLDEVAYIGEKSQGVKGLLTLSGTLTYTTPTTGAGGTTSWDNKGTQEILNDLNGPIDTMIVTTNSINTPNAWLMPVSRNRVIESRRAADGTDTTIKSFFLKNQTFINSITTTYRSESAPNSEWTGKRGVVYRNDSECLEMMITQPFEQLAPVAMHTTVTTICHMRTGGIALYQPDGVIYVDGI